jgi:hypothetical protein
LTFKGLTFKGGVEPAEITAAKRKSPVQLMPQIRNEMPHEQLLLLFNYQWKSVEERVTAMSEKKSLLWHHGAYKTFPASHKHA